MGLCSKESMSWPLLYHCMLLKITEKILSDRNTCIVLLFYRLHGDIFLIASVNIIDIVTVIVSSQ